MFIIAVTEGKEMREACLRFARSGRVCGAPTRQATTAAFGVPNANSHGI